MIAAVPVLNSKAGDKVMSHHAEKDKVSISYGEQHKAIQAALEECRKKSTESRPEITGPHCNRTWDSIMCWPPTRAGEYSEQFCPGYVHGFYKSGKATRYCLPDGEWYVHPTFNSTWTNYSECTNGTPPTSTFTFQKSHTQHLESIRVMYNIGYGVSFASLTFAVFVMIYFKRLHCPRNVVHLNLFMSFMLRATVSFLRDNLFDKGLGLSMDLIKNDDGVAVFNPEGLHWQCKLIVTLFHYMLAANYMWIFVEGLYLHTLVIVAVFSEKNSIRWYILLGWGGPLVFLLPWVTARATVEDLLCWNTNPTAIFWIMKGPIVITILVDFAFFVNVVRVLFTKLTKTSTPRARRFRYRRLAKSTLVLIPLFGVHYVVFIGVPDGVDYVTELVRLYYEMFFNSFQGFFVACLFCFFNGEVQSELRKKWIRYRLKTNSRRFQRIYWHTSSSNVLRNRVSSHPNSKSDNKGSNDRLSGTSSEHSSCERKRFQCFYENGRCYRASNTHVPDDTRQTVTLSKRNSFV